MRDRPCQRHVVVFAKVPRLGRVKTRLARDVGALAALRFYRKTLARTLRTLAADPRWRVWLAITPEGATLPPGFLPHGVRVIGQGRGDLGARMGRVLQGDVRRMGSVVIVGGDIPAIWREHIWRAFGELGGTDYVFGPATDGGYWLVGARARGRVMSPWRTRLFENVRWSTGTALHDTLANVRAGERIAIVDTLADVDRGADLTGRAKPKA